jgi:hypothetical protein
MWYSTTKPNCLVNEARRCVEMSSLSRRVALCAPAARREPEPKLIATVLFIHRWVLVRCNVLHRGCFEVGLTAYGACARLTLETQSTSRRRKRRSSQLITGTGSGCLMWH